MAVAKITCPKCNKRTSKASPFCLYCGFQFGDISFEEDAEGATTSSEETIKNETVTQNELVNGTKKIPFQSQEPSEKASTNIKSISQEKDSSSDNKNKMQELEETLEEEYEEEISLSEDDMYENEIAYDETDDELEDDDLEDDEEALRQIFQKETEITPEKETVKKASSLTAKRNISNLKEASSKASEGVINAFNTLKANNDVPKEKKRENKANTKPEKQITREDINADHYYDNIIAEVDARIEHISKENVIKTIGMVASVMLIIAIMVYFIIL